MKWLRCSALPILLSSIVLGQEATRTWTSSTGQTFEGIYLSDNAQKVTIRHANGQTVEVDRSRLSAADIAYVESKATAATAPQFKGYVAEMLKGYKETDPNFAQPWPRDTGISEEPTIITIEENPDEKRFIYESPHFRFQSNVLLRPSLLSKVAMIFEACYQTHDEIPLNNRRTRSPKAIKLKAHLFETKEDYFAAGGPRGTSGVYKGRTDEFLVPLEGLGVQKVGSGYMFDYKGDFHTVYHEITHLLWADLGNWAGMWMVEGFAEFIACAPYSNGRFSFIKQPSYALEYATAYGKKDNGGRALGDEFTMPPLERLMSWDQPTFYTNGNKNYGFGLILVYYFLLMEGDGTGARFKTCIKALQEGKSEAEARKVLMEGLTYEQLQKDLSTAFRRKGIRISFE